MKTKDAILATVIAALAAGAVAAGSAACAFRNRVKALEAKIAQTGAPTPVAVLSSEGGQAPGESPAGASASADGPDAARTKVAEMKVVSVGSEE